MCGKFTQMMSWREVVEFSNLTKATEGDEPEAATPMRFASVIHLDSQGQRKATRMRWGFQKKDSSDPKARPEFIHARAETVDKRPTFRDAFLNRRGILVVATFNEGPQLPNGKTEQHVIAPNDQLPLSIAVIWNREPFGEDALYTFVMMTVAANRLIGTITNRMPMMIQPDEDLVP